VIFDLVSTTTGLFENLEQFLRRSIQAIEVPIRKLSKGRSVQAMQVDRFSCPRGVNP